jgi:predicted nucleotidyltransferase
MADDAVQGKLGLTRQGVGMKALSDLQLAEQAQEALRALRDRIGAEFRPDRIVLFGSVVRGTSDEESDLDVLIVLQEPADHQIRNRISRLILDINLEHDTNLSGLVVDQKTWDGGLLSVLPIHDEVEEQGVQL